MSVIRKLATGCALTACMALSAPAFADQPQTLDVEIQFDNRALETVEGASLVLKSIEKQASQACSYARPISGAPRTDADCAETVVLKAVAQINDAELSRAFAQWRQASPQVFAKK